MKNAKQLGTIAAVTASFAVGIPAPTSAQTYGDYGNRDSNGYYYPRGSSDPANSAYSNSAYSYSSAASERGTVESVEVLAERGHGSGAGAVVGGVAGGLIGSQIGSGSANAAATIGGALGGAYLGNELERRRHADETLRFHVRMDDGSVRTFTQDTPEIRAGTRVRVTDQGQIVLS